MLTQRTKTVTKLSLVINLSGKVDLLSETKMFEELQNLNRPYF